MRKNFLPRAQVKIMKHLLKVIEGIEKGMRPLAEHELLDADE